LAGSDDYPAVIIPVLTQHYPMLQRNLLYTGVTRGKRLVVLVGQKKAVAIAVTVLHCAIATAGALAAALDPEDWRDIVAAFHACCSEVVQNFGGTVAQSADDGMLAWFGYPEAREFDAERAIRAGLALNLAVPKLQTGVDTPLRAHVGIAGGLVIVGDLAANPSPLRAALGEPSKIAAALLSRAPARAPPAIRHVDHVDTARSPLLFPGGSGRVSDEGSFGQHDIP
jgi:class 3 adenylate cyclase